MVSKWINIVLVDDHQIVLDALAGMLSASPNAYRIRTASSGREALLSIANNFSPDVLITDLDMPDMSGKELASILKERHPDCKLIVLSMHNEKAIIQDLMQVGVDGYLTKTCGQSELEAAINAVLNGRKFYTSEVLESLTKLVEPNAERSEFLQRLSDRELEVLKSIANGYSSKEIGDQLNISHRTVESHRNNLMQKLEVKNLAELIKVAVKNSLVD